VESTIQYNKTCHKASAPDDEDGTWIQPPIYMLDLSFSTQRIIDGVYSVVEEEVEITKDASQSWFWTDDWQTGERKVDEYSRKGIIEEFETMEDFLKTLLD